LYWKDSSGEKVYVPPYEFLEFTARSRMQQVFSIDDLPGYAGKFAVALIDLLHRESKPVWVSAFCPAWLYDRLRASGIDVSVREQVFVCELLTKSNDELRAIEETASVVRRCFSLIEELIGSSRVHDGHLWLGNSALTSTALLRRVRVFLAESDIICDPGVIACGEYSFLPHCFHEHPLLPNAPIVIDLAFKDLRHGFYCDVSRTYCKGNPRYERFGDLYAGVLSVKTRIEEAMHPGILVSDVFQQANEWLAEMGVTVECSTPEILKRTDAICHHALGHGIGRDLHQPPLLDGKAKVPLWAGMVLAVEPGAYLRGIGGVRIEDTVVITPEGCRNLTKGEYRLVID
jgi:Xaa-Pro aminopeptidase